MIDNFLPNNQRQRRTCCALCHILFPVSAAHMSTFEMDSNSTSALLFLIDLALLINILINLALSNIWSGRGEDRGAPVGAALLAVGERLAPLAEDRLGAHQICK